MVVMQIYVNSILNHRIKMLPKSHNYPSVVGLFVMALPREEKVVKIPDSRRCGGVAVASKEFGTGRNSGGHHDRPLLASSSCLL